MLACDKDYPRHSWKPVVRIERFCLRMSFEERGKQKIILFEESEDNNWLVSISPLIDSIFPQQYLYFLNWTLCPYDRPYTVSQKKKRAAPLKTAQKQYNIT